MNPSELQSNRIWQLACAIEPDEDRVREWWHNEALVALGGLKPCELLDRGLGDRLEAYLVAIYAEASE